MILKEESEEMKREILRKDELIKRHYEKLGDWQALLQDMQSTPGSSSNSSTTPNSSNSASAPVGSSGAAVTAGGGRVLLVPGSVPVGVSPGMNTIPQPASGDGGPSGQPTGFVPGNNYRTNIPGSPGMQGPLAYLDSMARK